MEKAEKVKLKEHQKKVIEEIIKNDSTTVSFPVTKKQKKVKDKFSR